MRNDHGWAGYTSLIDETRVRHVGIDGVDTRYYDAGTGAPIVFIHGGEFGGDGSLDEWDVSVATLADRYRVLAVDKLGQGETGAPSDPSGYTFDAVVDHLARWLRSLGITSACVVGHSRGGLAATILAIRYPQLASRLVIVDSASLAPVDPRFDTDAWYSELGRRLHQNPITRDEVRIEIDAQSYARDHVSNSLLGAMLKIAQQPSRVDVRRIFDIHGPAYRDVWSPSLARCRAEALAVIDGSGLARPILIVWGANDPSAPLPLGMALFQRICATNPDTTLHVFNRAGHYAYREHPQAFNRLLADFVG